MPVCLLLLISTIDSIFSGARYVLNEFKLDYGECFGGVYGRYDVRKHSQLLENDMFGILTQVTYKRDTMRMNRGSRIPRLQCDSNESTLHILGLIFALVNFIVDGQWMHVIRFAWHREVWLLTKDRTGRIGA